MPEDDYQRVTIGEVHRLLIAMSKDVSDLRKDVSDRHHRVVNQINTATAPISMHGVRLDTLEAKQRDTTNALNGVERRAYLISGGIATAAYILTWLRH